MELVQNAFYFIVALGILVTFHEFGHFWVARKLGVKVLTFSVGFGKPIWQKIGQDGVRYQIAAIPLGGYVKMLDERETEVAPEEKAQAFNRQSVGARMAIVLAGPLANFLLAIVLYWITFGMGITGLTTQVGEVAPTSIAAKAGLKAGDKIIAVDSAPVHLMQDVRIAIAARLGETSKIELTVEGENRLQRTLHLNIRDWRVDTTKPQILASLGIRHAIQDLVLAPKLAVVENGSPADKAGLQVGDLIVAYQSEPIEDWYQLVERIRTDSGKPVEMQITRNGELKDISVVIGSHKPAAETVGYLGVSPEAPDRSAYLTSRQGGLVESLGMAITETGEIISLTVTLFKKLLTGDISPKSLSGPISIAEGAGGSARGGLVYFLSFIAMISVNLGFINLLPIPMLDGGHLLFYSIEAIKGKPLSDKVQEIGMQIGILLVFGLMAVAIFNDISRTLIS